MKIIEGMSYREWQKRNSDHLQKLTQFQKKEVRQKGYHNVGWANVQKSWNVINQFLGLSSLFIHRLQKGDIVGAINHSMIEAEQASNLAKDAIETISKTKDDLNSLVNQALDKYQSI